MINMCVVLRRAVHYTSMTRNNQELRVSFLFNNHTICETFVNELLRHSVYKAINEVVINIKASKCY